MTMREMHLMVENLKNEMVILLFPRANRFDVKNFPHCCTVAKRVIPIARTVASIWNEMHTFLTSSLVVICVN